MADFMDKHDDLGAAFVCTYLLQLSLILC